LTVRFAKIVRLAIFIVTNWFNPKSAIELQILPGGLTNPPIGGLSGLTVAKKMFQP
jgi:hypothetical protein